MHYGWMVSAVHHMLCFLLKKNGVNVAETLNEQEELSSGCKRGKIEIRPYEIKE
jgi:hypothetical protein